MISDTTIIVPNTSRSQDPRGQILSIVDDKISNVSIITCVPGSIRSNHYHLKDFHYMYVLEGEIDYFFKPIKLFCEYFSSLIISVSLHYYWAFKVYIR